MASALRARPAFGAACSSRRSSFAGSKNGLNVDAGHKFVMMKQGIHPEWFEEAKVYCNGEEVLTVSGTKKEYVVDIYSGNHPFYQGIKTTVVVDEGQVNKFKKRFEGLEDLADLTAMNAAQESAAAGPYKGKDADDLVFDKKLITANKPKKKK